MDKKIAKVLSNINKYVDSDYKKLCDRLKDLELSHNRKKKALLKIQLSLAVIRKYNPRVTPFYEVSVDLLEAMEEVCESALFCDGRERTIVKGVKNG